MRVEIGEKDGCGTLHMKNDTDVLPNHAEFFEKNDTVLFLEGEKALSRATFTSTTTEYIMICYVEMKNEVMASGDSSNVRIENSDGNANLIV